MICMCIYIYTLHWGAHHALTLGAQVEAPNKSNKWFNQQISIVQKRKAILQSKVSSGRAKPTFQIFSVDHLALWTKSMWNVFTRQDHCWDVICRLAPLEQTWTISDLKKFYANIWTAKHGLISHSSTQYSIIFYANICKKSANQTSVAYPSHPFPPKKNHY